ncbi:MAG: hypothetical protein QOG87_1185 [Actinomycetota bacterium]
MGTSEDDGLRQQFGPDGEALPGPVAEAEPAEPGAPVVVAEDDVVVVDGPRAFTSRVVALLALGLIALFFVPWFDAGGFLRSSGAGLVSWTDRYIIDLPRGTFERQMLVPYLAALIPIGALVVCALAVLGRQVRWLTVATALIAPLLLVYAVAREGADVFRVLEAGAYLTLACSLALLAAGFGLAASRWGRVTLAGALALAVVAAFVIPALAQDDVDSRLFAAYASNRTTLDRPSSGGTTVTDTEEVASPTTTLVLTATTVLQVTTTTVATSTTAVGAATTTTNPCPRTGPRTVLDVWRFDQQAPGSDVYFIDVRGTTENRTGQSVNIGSIEVAVRRDSTEVGRITIPANRTLGSDQALDWFRDDETITSPGGPPTAADVVPVSYSWTDARFASCPRP